MKRTPFATLTLVLFFIALNPGYSIAENADPIHLEMDLDGFQYRSIMESDAFKKSAAGKKFSAFADNLDLTPVLNSGKRLLDWIIFINQGRAAGQKLSLSSAATQGGIPITAPGESNDTIVLTRFNKLKPTLPEWFASVVFKNAAFPEQLPVSDADFILLGRKLNGSYETASRWLLQAPALDAYSRVKTKDVRGFYFLTHTDDIEGKLKNFENLPAAEQEKISGWLVSICYNGLPLESLCSNQVAQLRQSHGDLLDFYQTYLTSGQNTWDSFFKIKVVRPEMVWNSANPNIFEVPFQNPQSVRVQNFLAQNIEDEWRWNLWQLKLSFDLQAPVHVEFESGATPHVNEVAGNKITMDSNQPLTEYGVQWMIRHEFGHVLGFPDCYVEFYDADKGVMVNYQLDLDNIMCSRHGHIQQRHYDELKRTYYQN
jgi:hypothetical protein